MYEGTLLLQELGGVGGLKVKEARQTRQGRHRSRGWTGVLGCLVRRGPVAGLPGRRGRPHGRRASRRKDVALATLKDSVTSPEARRRAETRSLGSSSWSANREAGKGRAGSDLGRSWSPDLRSGSTDLTIL